MKRMNEWLNKQLNMFSWISVSVTFFLLSAILTKHAEANGCKSCNELTPKELQPLIFRTEDTILKNKYPSINTNQLYYRYLMIDDITNSLFVGAMNYIFKLSLTDVTQNPKNLTLSSDKQEMCTFQGKQAVPDCQNHVRFIARNHSSSQSNALYVCGTSAHNPDGYIISADSLTKEADVLGKGVCPNDPFDNSTAIFVESGNPGIGNVSAVYSGTISDFRKSSIYRPPLYNPDGTEASGFMQSVDILVWLNDPQFVGSFDVGDKVLFFLRETALEFFNEKKIVSRVAKVCKKDKGGRSLLQNTWTSYQKARLNCSIPGEFPYYFDEIQDIVAVGSDTFYGLFTTSVNGLTASAICAYTLDDIEQSFEGLFKDQKDENSKWKAVPKENEPSIRPGNCSIEDSLALPDDVLSFIRLRPLMDKAVMHKYGKPIFYQGGVQMTRLAVIPKVNNDTDNLLFFTSSNAGDVYKIFTRMDNFMFKTTIATKYSIFQTPRPIWTLKLHNNYLYLATDEEVVQISVITCDQYTKVDSCAKDPQCAWARINSICVSFTNISRISDMRNYITYHNIDTYEENATEPLYRKMDFKRNTSSSVTFQVNYNLCTNDRYIRWTFQAANQGEEVDVPYDSTHQLTTDDSLIITKISTEDEGTYRARDMNNKILSVYTLDVMKGLDDVSKTWMEAFEEWSDMFEKQKILIENYQQSCTAP